MGRTRERDEGGDCLRDERGGIFVQALILLALVALAAMAGFKAVGGTVANQDVKNKATFEGSVEAAAIVVAFYADVKKEHGGATDSAEDMAVIWAAYRAGVAGVSPDGGGFASAEDFAQNRASGTDRYPPEFRVGGNAYQSMPFFENFKSR